jgi:recombination associated protein RdgC
MFFENLKIYRVTEKLPFVKDEDALQAQLEEHQFTPCMAHDMLKMGFVSPLVPGGKQLFRNVGGNYYFALKRQWKVLKSTMINEQLQPQITQKEQERGRPLGRKEKSGLKDETIQSLLPRALTESSTIVGMYVPAKDLLIFNTSSHGRAEDFMALLRKALGSLPAVPWFDANKLSFAMNSWLGQQHLPQDFVLGHTVELKAPDEDGAVAQFKSHLLTGADVQSHLEDKMVTKLELYKPEHLSFTIVEDGRICKLRWRELLINQNDELGWEDLEARLEADSLLMLDTITTLLDKLTGSMQAVDDAA